MLAMKASLIGGWTKWALGTAVVLWTIFLMFLYSCIFQHDFCDSFSQHNTSRRPYLQIHCDNLVLETTSLRDQLENLQMEYSLLQENFGRLLLSKQSSHQQQEGHLDSNVFQPAEIAFKASAKNRNLLRANPQKLIVKPWRLYSKEHEVQRKQLHNGLFELYHFLTSRFVLERLDSVQQDRLKDQLISTIADSFTLAEDVDHAKIWHRKALQDLGAQMQSRIHSLQNPEDCSNTKFLICDLNKACGFGCQIHHVTYCLIVAAASNRTLLLDKNGAEWKYSERGWKAAFEPISNCSYKKEVVTRGPHEQWSTVSQNTQIVYLPIVDVLNSRPPQLPQSIPNQLADSLLTHSSNPPVFVVSQFLRYVMRENEEFRKIFSKAEEKVAFDSGPIVGLHIRRTDKVGTEASFHALDDYMEWAEYWFRLEEKRRQSSKNFSLKRRVFIATDDKSVIREAKQKYKSTFEVFANDGIAETAQLQSRYTEESLVGVITDVRLLAKCDYVVCTFSSQICRVAYELMQAGGGGDMADRFHSLDDIYYFGGQLAHNWVATQAYTAKNREEIDMKPGDPIGIAGNQWNGFSKGLNKRTGKLGLFPTYMAREQWRFVDFPLFKDISSS